MKAEQKFKVGDEVTCISLGNDREGDYYARMDNLKVGKTCKVTAVGSNFVDEHGLWIELNHGMYWHSQDSFVPKLECITVVLRRPSDRKAIKKFIEAKGGNVRGGDACDSRIMNIHMNKTERVRKYDTTFNGACEWGSSVKFSIESNERFLKGEYPFGYKGLVVIKTKPSVKKAINEISKYMN